MTQPTSILNAQGQKLDVHVGADGTVRLNLAIGDKAVSGLANTAGWQGVATHTDGATPAVSDGVVMAAGYDPAGSGTVRKLLVDTTGKLLVSPTPAGGTLTNRSGTLTSGASAQSMMSANSTRKYLFIQNIDLTEDLWINFTTTAVADQPSIRLGPGDIFTMEDGFVSTEAVSVIAATTGHKWTAKEA